MKTKLEPVVEGYCRSFSHSSSLRILFLNEMKSSQNVVDEILLWEILKSVCCQMQVVWFVLCYLQQFAAPQMIL